MRSNVDIVGDGEVVSIVTHERCIDIHARAKVPTDRTFVSTGVMCPTRHENFAEVTVARLSRNVDCCVTRVIEAVHGAFAPLTLFQQLRSEWLE